jgi:hypothetical protein
MWWMRRQVGRVAAGWLVFHLCLLASVPTVCSAMSAGAGAACTCGHADGQWCPMHHSRSVSGEAPSSSHPRSCSVPPPCSVRRCQRLRRRPRSTRSRPSILSRSNRLPLPTRLRPAASPALPLHRSLIPVRDRSARRATGTAAGAETGSRAPQAEVGSPRGRSPADLCGRCGDARVELALVTCIAVG